MPGPSTADREREALCDLFLEVGPDAPTLSGEWSARDLAAHLVIRERRLDAAAGMFLPVLSKHTARVQDDVASQPWESIVATIRSGPPSWSPMRIDAINKNANTLEYFVHHEDVRRAADSWRPRPADRQRYAELKARLSLMAKLLYRKAPVSVTLDYLDGSTKGVRTVQGRGSVTIKGTPDEIALFTYGRDIQAEVTFAGEPADIAVLKQSARGI